MKQIDWTWAIPVLVFCMALMLGMVAILVIADDNGNDELFRPLYDFCVSQLRTQVDSCVDWAEVFIEMYGDAPAECLGAFDSDSPILLMCMDNIVSGR